MKFLDAKAIAGAAPISAWVIAMEQAMKDGLSGNVLLPPRMHLDRGENTFLVMPCVTDKFWATKLVSFCPGNRSLDLPSIYGTVVLTSSKTGEPLALLDGGIVTSLRTAAVSAVAIKYLAPENATRLGIIGAGVQAVQQARFACAIRNIRQIRVYDVVPDATARFIETLRNDLQDVEISVASDAELLCRQSDIIITATNSKEPVVPDEADVINGKTFVGIGSYKPECREYPDAFFTHLGQIFVDTPFAKVEAGDLIQPLKMGLIRENNIHSLGELIIGKVTLSTQSTRFCKTVGSALFDAYAAQLCYESISL